MKKRIFSGIIALAMLMSIIPATVSAAPVNTYDFISRWKNVHKEGNYTASIFTATDDEAHSGNFSAYIHNEATSGGFMWSRYSVGNLVKGDTYVIEAYAKGTVANDSVVQFYDGQNRRVSFMATPVTEADSDGWIKYQGTFAAQDYQELTTNGTVFSRDLGFKIEGGAVDLYLDDVTLYNQNDETKKNLLFDPGFESVANYTISTGYNHADWNAYYAYLNGNQAGDSQVGTDRFVTVTNADKHSGKYSLYAKHDGTNGMVWPRQSITVSEGVEYTLELWAKGYTANNNVLNFFDSDGIIGRVKILTESTKVEDNEYGWSKFQYKFTPSSSQTRDTGFKFEGIADLFLDDIVLYASNDATKTNLFKNGGFEAVVADVNPAMVSDTWRWADDTSTWTESEKQNHNFGLTDADYRSGTACAKFTYKDTTKTMNIVGALAAPLTSGKTYRISMWAKGDSPRVSLDTVLNWTDRNIWHLNAGTTDENGWTYYYIDKTITQNENFLQFSQFNAARTFMLDDYSIRELVNAETGELGDIEYARDGGFEQYHLVETQNLINPVSYPVNAGGALNLTWTNPANTITGMKVLVDGIEREGLTLNQTSQGYNSVLVDGLTNGTAYDIDVVATIGGVEKTFDFSGIPTVGTQLYPFLGNIYSDTWKFNKTDAGENYANAVAEIDDGTFKMTANIPEVVSNVYPGVTQDILGLNTDNFYKISFRYKTDGVSEIKMMFDTATIEGKDFIRYQEDLNAVADEWTDFSTYIGGDEGTDFLLGTSDDYDASLYIVSEQLKGSFWVDDVVLQVVDMDSGEGTGPNLIKNGTFEFPGYAIGEAEFKIAGESIDAIEAGTIEATAKIRNYAKGDSFAPSVVMALYIGGNLEEIRVFSANIPEIPYTTESTEMTHDFVIDADDMTNDPQIKIFYWDSFNTMNVLGDCAVID